MPFKLGIKATQRWHRAIWLLVDRKVHTIYDRQISALPDDYFKETVRIAQAELDQRHPGVVVGSRRGGSAAMNIDCGDAPLHRLRMMDEAMDQKTVRKLEREVEEAVTGVMARMGLRYLPLLPSSQTMHLMAKAAVAVYESAVENGAQTEAD